QVVPMGVSLEFLSISEHWPSAVFILQENSGQSSGEFSCYLPQREHVSRASWKFHFEVIAEVVMKLLQRLHQQIVYRKPNWAAPVRIAAEQASGRFTRLVVHAVLHRVHAEFVRMLMIESRNGANPVRRQEFILIQHVAKNSPQLIAVGNRKQPPLRHPARAHAGDVADQVWTVFDKPLHAPLETRQFLQEIGLQSLDRKQGNQAD